MHFMSSLLESIWDQKEVYVFLNPTILKNWYKKEKIKKARKAI
jgi:hypothetical protein